MLSPSFQPYEFAASLRVDGLCLLPSSWSLFLLARVAAQNPPSFASNTNLVVVPVTVTDRSGRFVRGLTADQFEISEGGTRRAVDAVQRRARPRQPRHPARYQRQHDGEPGCARGRRCAMGRHAPRARTAPDTAPLQSTKCSSRRSATKSRRLPGQTIVPTILRGFDLLRPGGGTALLDAVKLITPAFQRARHQRKVLLLISDGNDTSLPSRGRRSSVPFMTRRLKPGPDMGPVPADPAPEDH